MAGALDSTQSSKGREEVTTLGPDVGLACSDSLIDFPPSAKAARRHHISLLPTSAVESCYTG